MNYKVYLKVLAILFLAFALFATFMNFLKMNHALSVETIEEQRAWIFWFVRGLVVIIAAVGFIFLKKWALLLYAIPVLATNVYTITHDTWSWVLLIIPVIMYMSFGYNYKRLS